jgi:hypothetical protein
MLILNTDENADGNEILSIQVFPHSFSIVVIENTLKKMEEKEPVIFSLY